MNELIPKQSKYCINLRHISINMTLLTIFRSSDQTIEEQKQQIDQLKRYITESEDSYKSTEGWKRDVDHLKNKLQVNITIKST